MVDVSDSSYIRYDIDWDLDISWDNISMIETLKRVGVGALLLSAILIGVLAIAIIAKVVPIVFAIVVLFGACYALGTLYRI